MNGWEFSSALGLGILTSVIASRFYDWVTRPRLHVEANPSAERAQGSVPGQPPHEFFHLVVLNVPVVFRAPTVERRFEIFGRRPAWACQATLEVFDQEGRPQFKKPVLARWPSHPEPGIPAISGRGERVDLFDPGRMVVGTKVDLHCHKPEEICVGLKFEGEAECCLFNNESYLFPKWKNPAWVLPPGTFRLRVTLYYERAQESFDFRLVNAGPSRDDFRLEPWPDPGSTALHSSPASRHGS